MPCEERLFVEYARSPLAVGTRTPRFSWEVPLSGRSRRQTAYRVLVATSPSLLEPGMADLWDSGKVVSSHSVHVAYAGAAQQYGLLVVCAGVGRAGAGAGVQRSLVFRHGAL